MLWRHVSRNTTSLIGYQIRLKTIATTSAMSPKTHESLSIVSTSSKTYGSMGNIDRGLNAVTDAPAAIGPYSQGIRLGNLLFCSGCIPLDPSNMQIVPGGVEAQTEQVLKNLKAVVEAGGSELGKVVKTTVRQKILLGRI